MNFNQIKTVLSEKKYFSISLISFFVFLGLIFYFTNIKLNFGNFGNFAYFQLAMDFMIAFAFAIFLALFVHQYDISKRVRGKGGFVGGVIGTLFFGCAVCSITLAGYFGIAGLISLFPFYGIELKFLSLGILSISISKLTKTTC